MSPRTPSPKPDPTNFDLVNVLLVDDDSEILTILKYSLEARHYVVTTATNGLEALKEVMAQDFDVVLCDLMMPKMPGDMLYLAIQKTKPAQAERFIFITGCVEDSKMSDFLRTVKSPIIRKPFMPDDMFRAIQKVLREASPSR